MLIEPSRIKNCFLDNSEIEEAMIAACEEPSPGKKEQRGEIIAVKKAGLRICFLSILILLIFCSGIFVFCLIEQINADEPKSPVKRGRSGWFIGIFKDASPRKPARMKIIAAIIFCFSLESKNIEIQINKNDSILLIKE